MSTPPDPVPPPPRALAATRWSVLDRALVRAGRTPAEALRGTVDFAREVERLGYHRFWVAEHHAVPGVAGAAPTVLAAAVAAATSRLRVGTGGVMLPNHPPLVVAEQFGVLASLFPDRIDMGLGRSVGFTGAVRRALGTEHAAMDDFAAQLAELLSYFDGTGPVRAVPAQGVEVPAFVLAGRAGADTAADLGLPLVLAASADRARTRETAARYRERFAPRAAGGRPRLLLAVNAAVAATGEAARRRQLPEAWAVVHSRTRGDFPPLPPPEEVAGRARTEREERYLAEALAGQVSGTGQEVAARLAALVADTGAEEVMVTFTTHDPAEQLDSYRRLAHAVGIGAPSA